MASRKKYTKEQYLRGNPKYNLLLNERILLIKAMIKSKWKMKVALKFSFPKENITISTYNHMLLDHNIFASEKSFKKLSEID